MDPRHSNDVNYNNEYNGVCFGTGAQRTVIGLQQAKAYCKTCKRLFRPKPNNLVYIFCEDRRNSLVAIPIRIPTSNNAFIEVMADVVTANITFLLGLDTYVSSGLTFAYQPTNSDVTIRVGTSTPNRSLVVYTFERAT
jgi:hypothetical protein